MDFALKKVSRGCCSSLHVVLADYSEFGIILHCEFDSPVDVAELMFALPSLERDGDIERPAGGDGASHSRHGDDGDVFDLNVGGGFGDEHEGFVEAEEEAFVGFDRAFNAVHIVVATQIHISLD